MKHLRNILTFSSVVVLIFLSGCVSLVQEMSIAEDGSGTLRFALGVETESYEQFQERMPEEYQLENFLAAFVQNENINDVQQTHYDEGGYTWDAIEIEVADFSLLFGEERRIGPLAISLDSEGESTTFFETIDIPASNLEIPGINLLDLTGAGFTVRLIAPQIVDTTGLQTSAGVSEWEIPLSELVQGGETVYLQAEYTLETYQGLFIPWEVFFPYVVIGFLGLGVLSILGVIIINTRKKPKDSQQIEF